MWTPESTTTDWPVIALDSSDARVASLASAGWTAEYAMTADPVSTNAVPAVAATRRLRSDGHPLARLRGTRLGEGRIEIFITAPDTCGAYD